jgi:glucose/galactose transporter
LFLLALFTLSTGMTLMQTAINPYIVCIGSRESAAMRISIMGLFNKGAGVVVPLIFSAFMLSGMSAYSDSALALLDEAGKNAMRADLSLRLVFPYTIMAGALLLIMMIVYFSSFQDITSEKDEADQTVTKLGVLQYPQLVLGALALFTYVGVEVIAGDTIGLYGHSLGVQKFGILTSYTMGFMVLGYLLGVVAIPKYLLQKNALLLSAVCGLLFTLGVVVSSTTNTNISEILVGWAGVPVVPNTVMFLALLGFANALVWPSIWPLALEGLGKYTASGSALLIMGIAGGAVIPLLYGKISDVTNSQAAYWVMVPAYAFILFYALKGHKLKSWK